MPLEAELQELGAYLDHPTGDGIPAAVREAFEPTTTVELNSRRARRKRWPMVLAAAAAAAAIVLVFTLALRSTPSRGTPKPRSGTALPAREHPPRDRSGSPGTTATSSPPVVALDLPQARAAVEFPIRVPQGMDAPPHVLVDRTVPGGLVALRYPAFTLVELASPLNSSVVDVTSLDAASKASPMVVRGQPALWIAGGPHEIGYRDRDRALHRAPTRTSGHVLVWVEQGVTYRIEGFAYQSSAMAMARSLT